MQRYVKSESLVDKFLRYHDDESNWAHNQNGFDKMYEILEKYDDSNGTDTVDVAFMKATPAGEYGKGDYYDGIKDAFDALFREGFLDRSDFEMPY